MAATVRSRKWAEVHRIDRKTQSARFGGGIDAWTLEERRARQTDGPLNPSSHAWLPCCSDIGPSCEGTTRPVRGDLRTDSQSERNDHLAVGSYECEVICTASHKRTFLRWIGEHPDRVAVRRARSRDLLRWGNAVSRARRRREPSPTPGRSGALRAQRVALLPEGRDGGGCRQAAAADEQHLVDHLPHSLARALLLAALDAGPHRRCAGAQPRGQFDVSGWHGGVPRGSAGRWTV